MILAKLFHEWMQTLVKIYVVIARNNCFMVKFQFFAEKFDSKLFLTQLTSFLRMKTCIFRFLVIFCIRKVLRCKFYQRIERIYNKQQTTRWHSPCDGNRILWCLNLILLMLWTFDVVHDTLICVVGLYLSSF